MKLATLPPEALVYEVIDTPRIDDDAPAVGDILEAVMFKRDTGGLWIRVLKPFGERLFPWDMRFWELKPLPQAAKDALKVGLS